MPLVRPSSLSDKLSHQFEADVRQRGQSYYQRRHVRIRHGSQQEVDASVTGAREYDAMLGLEGNVFRMWCDCEYFEDHGPCKHLWATVLAAEARGLLTDATARQLKFLYVKHEPEFDLDFTDEFIPQRAKVRPIRTQSPPPPPVWRRQLDNLVRQAPRSSSTTPQFPSKRQILYVVEGAEPQPADKLLIALFSRDRKVNGEFTRLTLLNLKRAQLTQLPAVEDREILAMLAGSRQYYGWEGSDGYESIPTQCVPPLPLAVHLIQSAIQTGRCFLRLARDTDELFPLSWDDGEPWRFSLEMHRDGRDEGWEVEGILRRGEERLNLAEIAAVSENLVVTRDRVARFEGSDHLDWFRYFSKEGKIQAPDRDGAALVEALLNSPRLPDFQVPEELQFQETRVTPRPGLRIEGDRSVVSSRLRAHLSFDYSGRTIQPEEGTSGYYDAATSRYIRRDPVAEKAAEDLLNEVGARYTPAGYHENEAAWEIAPTKLPRVVRALVEAGWHLEAEGKTFRRPGEFQMEVSSGVDWFELHGEVSYGDTSARLPELLAAMRRGETMVRLKDGTYGLLPEELLARIGSLANMGAAQEDHIRFRRSQAGLLDALLATQPEARSDETFARMRDQLRAFEGIAAAEQPAGFSGHLRDYQRDGLGWMHFLRQFGFGGCLADDMGVGKTAQVLALLETRRELRAKGEVKLPSLVVVPKSLVFNWKEEAARFTPQLRVLDYTGLTREGAEFDAHDVVLTTYGTMRRDALRLKDVEFDYIVLDEAQAVKNAATESSKAVRLLRGANRLALSGTPVENHLGELWTLFEFLNPGMLGAASVFRLAGGTSRTIGEEARQLLGQALRPFILRRTKEQVARELPPKTEQTIYCEMEPEQRKLYNELRDHYRNSLLGRVASEGLAKSKIQVLEALLRLRQAACHPGLLDGKRVEEPSAKLDVLLAQLSEVMSEGHKALVFSQFTSLLAIVRQRLDAEKIPYEYLDGSTTNRQACVERFQNDPDCPLFLVSLKAGGLGLNLTAAEYVFLLDPWWNPAVEAQAVDRAHRIGQTRQVFAYRLIARDTVEEKVLELQTSKRDLAAAIISQDNSLIRNLKREDLELLLS
jgi:superfamily II DNA or RNA helicase